MAAFPKFCSVRNVQGSCTKLVQPCRLVLTQIEAGAFRGRQQSIPKSYLDICTEFVDPSEDEFVFVDNIVLHPSSYIENTSLFPMPCIVVMCDAHLREDGRHTETVTRRGPLRLDTGQA